MSWLAIFAGVGAILGILNLWLIFRVVAVIDQLRKGDRRSYRKDKYR